MNAALTASIAFYTNLFNAAIEAGESTEAIEGCLTAIMELDSAEMDAEDACRADVARAENERRAATRWCGGSDIMVYSGGYLHTL